jgi:hypothetical protein
VPPDGWRGPDGDGYYDGPNGEESKGPPEGSKAEGVIVLTNAIKDMGALAKFVFSGDDNSKSITMETAMTVANFSWKGLGVYGAIMLSAFLPKCT